MFLKISADSEPISGWMVVVVADDGGRFFSAQEAYICKRDCDWIEGGSLAQTHVYNVQEIVGGGGKDGGTAAEPYSW